MSRSTGFSYNRFVFNLPFNLYFFSSYSFLYLCLNVFVGLFLLLICFVSLLSCSLSFWNVSNVSTRSTLLIHWNFFIISVHVSCSVFLFRLSALKDFPFISCVHVFGINFYIDRYLCVGILLTTNTVCVFVWYHWSFGFSSELKFFLSLRIYTHGAFIHACRCPIRCFP